MPLGGRLTIETSHIVLDEEYVAGHVGAREGEHVLLSVSDTGTGMSEEVKAHLFEPFFAAKEPGKGTGLGLAGVFGVVKQLGGNINAYSEEGVGSVFRIYLPRTFEEARSAVGVGAAPQALAGGRIILLVEDATGVRELASDVLRDLGHRAPEDKRCGPDPEGHGSGRPGP